MNGPELIQCVFAPLRNKGIGKLHDLVSEEEVEIDRNFLKRMKMVVVNLPVGLIEYAASYIEDINDLKVQPFDKIGTPMEIVKLFGNKQKYLEALQELKNQLYMAS